MDISHEDLFRNALEDEPTTSHEDQGTGQDPNAFGHELQGREQVQDDGQPRDEHGRFAQKADEPVKTEAKAPEPGKPDEAMVPSWRLREIREAREAAENRARQLEQQLQQFRQQQQPAQRPDPFENPEGHARSVVAEQVDPISQQMTQMREYYSRLDAEREFGAEKVKEAYETIAQGLQTKDPDAIIAYQRAMQSIHPYREISNWHKERQLVREIGGDPQKWFDQQLEKRLADEKFKADLAAKLTPAQQTPNPVFKVPPSLNRAAAAASTLDEGGDLSNESLFRSALA